MAYALRVGKKMPDISICLPGGERINIKVRDSKRANRFIMRVNQQTSEFYISRPIWRSIDEARIFVERNVPWIAEQLMKLPARVQFRHGSIVPILGKEYKIAHSPKEFGNVWLKESIDNQMPELRVSGGSEHMARRVRDWLKKRAKDEVSYKAKKFASLLNMEIKSVSVRDTRTRWGSCSSSGNLSFCWRLIFAPEKIVDYVCAHEAAHLVELNHSPRFWQTVHQLVGEWKSSKKWLKENGARLHRYG